MPQPSSKADAEDTYNEWIEKSQANCSVAHDEYLGFVGGSLTLGAEPPAFRADTIFKDTMEDYAMQLTSAALQDVACIVPKTLDGGMFVVCMVGQLEGWFLKMFVKTAQAKTVLDIGIFTGYSALSFAERLPADGTLVTVKNDERIVAVAKRCFDASAHASKMDLVGSHYMCFYFKCTFLYVKNAFRFPAESVKNYSTLLLPDLTVLCTAGRTHMHEPSSAPAEGQTRTPRPPCTWAPPPPS